MKKVYLPLLFLLLSFTGMAQEIDFRKFAKQVINNPSEDYIEYLEHMYTNDEGRPLVKKLYNICTKIEDLRDRKETMVNDANSKSKEYVKEIEACQSRKDAVMRKRKDLDRKVDFYEREAKKSYSNHDIASNFNARAARNHYNSYKEYKNKARYYVRKYNNYTSGIGKRTWEHNEKRKQELIKKNNAMVTEARRRSKEMTRRIREYIEEKKLLRDRLFRLGIEQGKKRNKK